MISLACEAAIQDLKENSEWSCMIAELRTWVCSDVLAVSSVTLTLNSVLLTLISQTSKRCVMYYTSRTSLYHHTSAGGFLQMSWETGWAECYLRVNTAAFRETRRPGSKVKLQMLQMTDVNVQEVWVCVSVFQIDGGGRIAQNVELKKFLAQLKIAGYFNKCI